MKVKFAFYNSLLERDEVETMWADIVDEKEGHFKLKNIPFFVTGYAADDVVRTFRNVDEIPLVTGLVEESGNSTIHIIFLVEDDEYKKSVLQRLSEFGAEYEGLEGMIIGYYALNIPKSIDYHAIVDLLKKESDHLDFREACIGHPG